MDSIIVAVPSWLVSRAISLTMRALTVVDRLIVIPSWFPVEGISTGGIIVQTSFKNAESPEGG